MSSSGRKKGMPAAHSSHPNVTPLIDIVMCLIIFFMLVAKIGVSTGAEASIDIPVSSLGKDLKDMGNTLVLNVREVQEQPFITAMVDGTSGKAQEVKIVDPVTKKKQLAEILRKLRFGLDGKPGGTGTNADNDEFKVIIRGDQGMGYRSVAPVLQSCTEAAVKNFNFQAGKPQ